MIILHHGANVWNSLPWKLLFFPNVIYLWAQRWSQQVSIFFPLFFSWTIGIRDGETAVCSDLSATGINFHIPLNHKIEAIKASLASHYTSTCRSYIFMSASLVPITVLLSSLITSAYVFVLTGVLSLTGSQQVWLKSSIQIFELKINLSTVNFSGPDKLQII